ncbi:uncharacterized protein LOC121988458 [Zingiber officinale]|uniref:uncharacterized protein LOC121988458 n=1 Tax=Zingiber officinale TaxID=94328 RepID=UPI001C4C8EED|nr:uncharacterized protein LOC121988458 [Zingiber officinale]
MASSRRSSGSACPFRRSIAPAEGRSGFASSSTSLSACSPATFFHHHQRSASSTRVHLAGAGSTLAPSVLFSSNSRSASPARSIATGADKRSSPARRRTCLCSPSTHPGSFRCHLHKGLNLREAGGSTVAAASPSNRLNARRSAMANSLVRIGAVEGELVKRALSALIRPSSHQQRRRVAFQPRPSRLSRMSKAEDP